MLNCTGQVSCSVMSTVRKYLAWKAKLDHRLELEFATLVGLEGDLLFRWHRLDTLLGRECDLTFRLYNSFGEG